MSPEEALTLCRLAKAIAPAQAMDEYTPDAWALLLEPERFVDAREALQQLGREQSFIDPKDIIARVARIRRDRLLAFGVVPDPPSEVGADPAAYRAWIARTRRAIADGEDVPRPALAPAGSRPDIDFTNVITSVEDAS